MSCRGGQLQPAGQQSPARCHPPQRFATMFPAIIPHAAIQPAIYQSYISGAEAQRDGRKGR
ncbi:hypothetical protein E4U19_001382 [Claviceps sp. Clav32 group G5]|nr:hypothetical protein E4U19_001382 [Claviceps sp. Clav32 group G5]